MSNTPLGAAPFFIGTKPASVSRFSTLHACQRPSETQPEPAAEAPGVLEAELPAGVVAAEDGLDGLDAESDGGGPSPPHAASALHRVPVSAMRRVTRTPSRIRRSRRA